MDNGPWHNTTSISQLNAQNFEDFFKTGRKDRHQLLCAANKHGKYHIPIPDNISSGGGIPLKI